MAFFVRLKLRRTLPSAETMLTKPGDVYWLATKSPVDSWMACHGSVTPSGRRISLTRSPIVVYSCTLFLVRHDTNRLCALLTERPSGILSTAQLFDAWGLVSSTRWTVHNFQSPAYRQYCCSEDKPLLKIHLIALVYASASVRSWFWRRRFQLPFRGYV